MKTLNEDFIAGDGLIADGAYEVYSSGKAKYDAVSAITDWETAGQTSLVGGGIQRSDIGILANDVLDLVSSGVNGIQLVADDDTQPYSRMNVSAGGTANNTTVSSGGQLHVYTSGQAYNTVVAPNGIMYVSDGVAQLTGITSGRQIVYGGLTSQVTLNDEGILEVSGGLARAVSVWSDGKAYVYEGGVISDVNVQNGGALYLSGGSVVGGIINGGGVEEVVDGVDFETIVRGGGIQNVYSGGTAISASVLATGQQNVSGGVVSGTMIISGAINVYAGVASNVVIENEGVLNSYDGITSHADIAKFGVHNIYGGKTSQGNVLEGAIQNIYAGSVYNINIFNSGIQNVSGGFMQNGAAYEGGVQNVYSGGSGNNLRVFSGGGQNVYDGGHANNVEVSNGGLQAIFSGGSMDGGVVSSGGVVTLASGAHATGGIQMGGSAIVDSGADTTYWDVYLVMGEWQPGDLLVNDISLLSRGIHTIKQVHSMAYGNYEIAGNTGGGMVKNVVTFEGATTDPNAVGSSMLWDTDSLHYTGVIYQGNRYSLKSDAGSDLILVVSQRYVVLGHTAVDYVGNDISYTDQFHSGVDASSVYGILVSTETYGNAIVMGGKGKNITGTVTTEVNSATLNKILYAGTMNGTIGSTVVSISAGSVLNDNVFCGSMASSGTTAIQSGISVTVNGGTFEKGLYGGSRISGGTHTITGGITMDINGGTFRKDMWIMGGGYVTGASSVLTVNGGVHVTADNLAFTAGTDAKGRGLYLGAWVTTNGKAYVKDGVTATINTGTQLTYMYGGGWSQGGANSLSVVDANGATYAVDITVNGGSIDYLFGGGSHAYLGAVGTEGGASTVIGNIRITINGGTFNQISVSGDYATDTVTGDGELIFTGLSTTSVSTVYGYRYDNMSGAAMLTFDGYSGAFTAAVYNFNAVKFAGDAAVALNGQDLSEVSDWHFDGEGRTSTGTMAEWDTGTNDFTGDIFHIWLTGSYETELTLLTSTDSGIFQNYTDLKFQIYVDGTQVGGTFDFDSKYNGWGLNFSNNTLKYTNLA